MRSIPCLSILGPAIDLSTGEIFVAADVRDGGKYCTARSQGAYKLFGQVSDD